MEDKKVELAERIARELKNESYDKQNYMLAWLDGWKSCQNALLIESKLSSVKKLNVSEQEGNMEFDLDKLIAKYIYKGIDDVVNELYVNQNIDNQNVKEKEYIKEKASKHIDDVMNAYFSKQYINFLDLIFLLEYLLPTI